MYQLHVLPHSGKVKGIHPCSKMEINNVLGKLPAMDEASLCANGTLLHHKADTEVQYPGHLFVISLFRRQGPGIQRVREDHGRSVTVSRGFRSLIQESYNTQVDIFRERFITTSSLHQIHNTKCHVVTTILPSKVRNII